MQRLKGLIQTGFGYLHSRAKSRKTWFQVFLFKFNYRQKPVEGS